MLAVERMKVKDGDKDQVEREGERREGERR